MHEIPDERLRLVFTCCHPALPTEAASRSRCAPSAGSRPARSRARSCRPSPPWRNGSCERRRRSARPGIPYRVPPRELLEERLTGVLAVLYLIFNEGYSATSGDDLVRADLCDEAIWLTRVVDRLLPDQPEVRGLLALMLLQHSRRATRTDADGRLVLLEDQDRARWDHEMIDEGLAVLDDALALRAPGPYQLQAAIAALHAQAPRPEDTDWPQIATLYGALAATGDEPRGRAEPRRRRGDGRRPRRGAAARRRPRRRPRRLPPLPRRTSRPAPAPRAWRRGGGRLPSSAGARHQPGRARFLQRRLAEL